MVKRLFCLWWTIAMEYVDGLQSVLVGKPSPKEGLYVEYVKVIWDEMVVFRVLDFKRPRLGSHLQNLPS
jgi:hypothetical protein